MPSTPTVVGRTGTPSVVVAGVRVDSFSEVTIVERVIAMATSPGVDVAVGVNAHVCNLARNDAAFQSLVSAGTTYADGQSVVWAARLLGGDHPHRLATTDIAEPILRAAAAAGIPAYFLGGAPGVAEAAADKMRTAIPTLSLRSHHGFIEADSVDAVLADITAHNTGILFVGMGDPLQQQWIEAHRDQLPPAVLTCGGLFDWLSGSNRRAPRWMITAGLEWLWRLMIEPRRLAKRYLQGNTSFILTVGRQKLAGR
ncbi:WecB/TagA/CpsF family glycosyltransferase [uncultured Microbacterium sp.]|uniref:WecB/TagA/CpsF family glycosyltransferase n=1 Tax=uncultured Microbacterium sp. TaxID=191216 RepID=UPI0026069EB2|nr:WecB/TagA/CpsF family glycosyltransferase [uncultured Microbacterium sp.]